MLECLRQAVSRAQVCVLPYRATDSFREGSYVNSPVAIWAVSRQLARDVRIGPDGDVCGLGHALDGLKGCENGGPGFVGRVRGVDVAVVDPPRVVGLVVQVDVDAADGVVGEDGVGVDLMPRGHDFRELVPGVYFVAVPKARWVGGRNRLVSKRGDNAEVALSGAAEGEVEISMGG